MLLVGASRQPRHFVPALSLKLITYLCNFPKPSPSTLSKVVRLTPTLNLKLTLTLTLTLSRAYYLFSKILTTLILIQL